MNLVQAIEVDEFNASLDDSMEELLDRVELRGYDAIPVIRDQIYLGLLTMDQLLEVEDVKKPLGALKLPFKQLFMYGDQHLVDALPYFDSQESNVLPIIDTNMRYLGYITSIGVLGALNTLLDAERPGAVLVLEVGQRDNALSHIAHIIESADAQVLASFSRVVPDSSRLEITVKINTTDTSSVVASLLRYDYQIKNTYGQEIDKEGIHARYEHLMNYINM